MQTMLQNWPFKAPIAGFHRFTVDQYHRMIEIGVLTENDRVELLEGYLVEKMPQDPLHDGTLQLVEDAVLQHTPMEWCGRVQMAVTLGRSEPEPDFVLARGNKRTYLKRHPGPGDIALVVEVSNSTLESDRDDKLPIYSRVGLPVYWIVNVVDMQVEVYEQPAGLKYTTSRIYKKGATIPLEVDGTVVASVPVDDLLP
jgi:Uma2 family endonuclease